MNFALNAQKNLKKFPLYKMFSWDLLFYYAIIFLFLVKVKNLTASQVFLADAFYPIFKFVFQILCIHITDNIGKRKALLIGNIFVNASILMTIFCMDLIGLIFVNLLLAIGYNLKELCEAPFLNSSILDKENKREIFSKIDSSASSKFYLLDSIAAISTGFLFAFNNYLPLVLCFVFSLIGTIISFTFEEIENNSSSVSQNTTKVFFKDLHHVFKHIITSKRLRGLLLFSAFFTSLLSVFKTYMNSLFVDLNLPDIYFGLITAGIQIISAISSKRQNYFHKKYRNRVLTLFAIPLSSLMLVVGLATVCKFPYPIIYLAIFTMVLFYAIVKGPYYTLIKRYLNSFIHSHITTKIYAINTMCDSVCRTLIYLLSSFLLSITNTAFSLIILSSLFTLAFIFILEYMKTRVGLSPEKYGPSDIIK